MLENSELKVALSIAFFTTDCSTLKRIALLSVSSQTTRPDILWQTAIDVLSVKLSTREYSNLLSQIEFESIMA